MPSKYIVNNNNTTSSSNLTIKDRQIMWESLLSKCHEENLQLDKKRNKLQSQIDSIKYFLDRQLNGNASISEILTTSVCQNGQEHTTNTENNDQPLVFNVGFVTQDLNPENTEEKTNNHTRNTTHQPNTCFDELSKELSEKNKQATEELKAAKLEILKHSMKRLDVTLNSILQNAENRSDLFQKDLESSKSMVSKKCTHIQIMSFLQNELNSVCKILDDVKDAKTILINDEKEEHQCNCKFHKNNVEQIKETGAKGDTKENKLDTEEHSDDSLTGIARQLSQTLLDMESCPKCQKIPDGVKNTVKCIKNLLDLLEKTSSAFSKTYPNVKSELKTDLQSKSSVSKIQEDLPTFSKALPDSNFKPTEICTTKDASTFKENYPVVLTSSKNEDVGNIYEEISQISIDISCSNTLTCTEPDIKIKLNVSEEPNTDLSVTVTLDTFGSVREIMTEGPHGVIDSLVTYSKSRNKIDVTTEISYLEFDCPAIKSETSLVSSHSFPITPNRVHSESSVLLHRASFSPPTVELEEFASEKVLVRLQTNSSMQTLPIEETKHANVHVQVEKNDTASLEYCSDFFVTDTEFVYGAEESKVILANVTKENKHTEDTTTETALETIYSAAEITIEENKIAIAEQENGYEEEISENVDNEYSESKTLSSSDNITLTENQIESEIMEKDVIEFNTTELADKKTLGTDVATDKKQNANDSIADYVEAWKAQFGERKPPYLSPSESNLLTQLTEKANRSPEAEYWKGIFNSNISVVPQKKDEANKNPSAKSIKEPLSTSSSNEDKKSSIISAAALVTPFAKITTEVTFLAPPLFFEETPNNSSKTEAIISAASKLTEQMNSLSTIIKRQIIPDSVDAALEKTILKESNQVIETIKNMNSDAQPVSNANKLFKSRTSQTLSEKLKSQEEHESETNVTENKSKGDAELFVPSNKLGSISIGDDPALVSQPHKSRPTTPRSSKSEEISMDKSKTNILLHRTRFRSLATKNIGTYSLESDQKQCDKDKPPVKRCVKSTSQLLKNKVHGATKASSKYGSRSLREQIHSTNKKRSARSSRSLLTGKAVYSSRESSIDSKASSIEGCITSSKQQRSSLEHSSFKRVCKNQESNSCCASRRMRQSKNPAQNSYDIQQKRKNSNKKQNDQEENIEASEKTAVISTFSELKRELSVLEEKCREKDRVIALMCSELQLSTKMKTLNEQTFKLTEQTVMKSEINETRISTLDTSVEKLYSEPTSKIDQPSISQQSLCKTEKNKKSVCTSISSNKKYKPVKKRNSSSAPKKSTRASNRKKNESTKKSLSKVEEILAVSNSSSDDTMSDYSSALLQKRTITIPFTGSDANSSSMLQIVSDSPTDINDSSQMKILRIQRICPESAILRWSLPKNKYVKGYEIVIDGIVISRICNPRRTTDILTIPSNKETISLALFAITPYGRCQPPARVIYHNY